MNWNQQPRQAVEAAAKAGNIDAQAALRIHEALDRIEAVFNETRTHIHERFDAIDADLEMLRTTLLKNKE